MKVVKKWWTLIVLIVVGAVFLLLAFWPLSKCGTFKGGCMHSISTDDLLSLQRAARGGDMKSNGMLVDYYFGRLDNKEAHSWLLNAAKFNDYNAVRFLFLEIGSGNFQEVSSSDRRIVFDRLVDFAKKNDADAQYWLGQGCLTNEFFGDCKNKGVYWLTKSAISGNRAAMEVLSSKLIGGVSSTEEKEAARAWAEEMAKGDAPPYYKKKAGDILKKISIDF